MTGSPEWNGEGKPPFTEADARILVGKRILVGVTRLNTDGSVAGQEQMHGTITQADKTGIMIALEGDREGETWRMPPDMRAIQPAKPGEYRLRGTGEVVIDPDYTATWTIEKQSRH